MNAAVLDEPTTIAGKKQSQGRSMGRLAVNIPSDLIDELKTLADEEGVTLTEVVRRAISAEKFLRSQTADGRQLLVLERGETKPSKVVVFR